MTLSGTQAVAPNGLKAFDTNTVLSADRAHLFFAGGYRACIRYVPRLVRRDYDLTNAEAQRILAAGLALGIVQHVAPENWVPTPALGAKYGATAVNECQLIGVPPGVNVWCDLEGVKTGTPAADVIAYLNTWWDVVATAGYLPGLYVGWHAGLTGTELYSKLKFQYYWSAYNLNNDQYPAVRGVCMRQRLEQRIAGVAFDPDDCTTDALNNKATFLAPSNWHV